MRVSVKLMVRKYSFIRYKVPYRIQDSSSVSAGSTLGYNAVLSLSIDSTEYYLISRQVRNQSNYDLLTGLANRNLLRRRIKQAIAYSRHVGKMGTLLFIDLDNFREINEVYGHLSGDFFY